MEMITYKCPHCGANLQVGFGARRIVCDYCDSEVWIEDAATRAADAEEEGYRYEMGRQRAKRESERFDDERSSGSYNYNVNYTVQIASQKNRMIALILCIFLGVFGAHRFYVGKIGTGILYLFTGAIFGIGYIYDFVMILLGAFRDRDGLPVKNW